MGDQPLWVFGYGSLIWHPGFEFEQSLVATMPGYHRSFCMRSIHHRGTVDQPGLVLALDARQGANCTGVAFQVAGGCESATIAYLRERELISSAYLEITSMLSLGDGQNIQALTYVIDTQHSQYCSGIPLPEQAEIIANASGQRGSNADYLHNTVAHLNALDIQDTDLLWLDGQVRGIAG